MDPYERKAYQVDQEKMIIHRHRAILTRPLSLYIVIFRGGDYHQG